MTQRPLLGAFLNPPALPVVLNNLPVVTSNSAIVRQVMGNAARNALYGDVRIFQPLLDFNSADELVNLVRSANGN